MPEEKTELFVAARVGTPWKSLQEAHGPKGGTWPCRRRHYSNKGYLSRCSIPSCHQDRLLKFVAAIEQAYLDVPYHNNMHVPGAEN